MADRTPVKATIVSGAATGLAEFAAGDTVSMLNGGTGATTASAARTNLGAAPASRPVFWYTKSASQPLTINAFNKVTFDTNVVDSVSGWDATNNRYAPNVAGWYSANWGVGVSATGGVTDGVSELRKGVTAVGASATFQGSSGQNVYTGSKLVFLNGSTDYLEVHVITVGAGTHSVLNTLKFTFFDAFKVSD